MKDSFFGRKRQMKILQRLQTKRTASLVVIKGRRRIGKSRLTEEFAKPFNHYIFVGLPPEKGVTSQKQRDNFASQMERELSMPKPRADDWGDLFWFLANQTKDGRVVIVLDEINWMGSKDPTFLGKLKTAWDLHFKKNPDLILILSGSMSSWIESNILSSTGFLGRISTNMTLDELPLRVCNHFWKPREDFVSNYEKFKVLSVVGGVPRYLEEIRPEWTAEENIRVLCFEEEGLLFNEFNRIFTDLFSSHAGVYRTIIERLAQGSATQEEVSSALGMKKGGTIGKYLEDLVITGYVSRDHTWSLSSGKTSKLRKYRLKDNYLRFYLKYIEPNREKIQNDTLESLPAWDSIMGLQFENLVLNNHLDIRRLLNISPSDVVNEGCYFQRQTKSRFGCQIDYLIQTKYNALFLCEVKFSKNAIGTSVVGEVKAKIKNLACSPRFTIWPVLIHVNGVSESLQETAFFSHTIDFGDLFKVDQR